MLLRKMIHPDLVLLLEAVKSFKNWMLWFTCSGFSEAVLTIKGGVGTGEMCKLFPEEHELGRSFQGSAGQSLTDRRSGVRESLLCPVLPPNASPSGDQIGRLCCGCRHLHGVC